jgi:TetR/AcrR family transcriptional regulator, transcriptional repressor for nem operon
LKDSKEHILEVSLNLFLQKNFKEVTMQEIVEKTGLSKGAFYHYFKSKEQVFEDVIKHYYTDFIIIDYSKFSQTSLVQFYTDVLLEKKEKMSTSKIMDSNEDKVFTSNHYFLMFDAMKLFPDFKMQRIQQQQDELKIWIKIIGIAKKGKEINSKMNAEQIAKLFLYASKGSGINCIMADKFDNSTKEIKALWDGLYNELRK